MRHSPDRPLKASIVVRPNRKLLVCEGLISFHASSDFFEWLAKVRATGLEVY